MLRRLSPLLLLACLFLLLALYPSRGNVASAQAPAVEAASAVRAPVGSSFTYQGRLTEASAPAVGEYDFQFRLYDGPSAGSTQIGSTETREDVTVTDGTFTVYLDFGSAAFNGEGRWLELAVRLSEPTGNAPYNTLSPRQPLTPTPYALHAAEAGSVAWSGVTGVPSTLSFLAAPSPCASGQVPKWDGSAWACAADANSGGDITGVTAGTGLSGGGTSGDVTVSADTSYLQRRLNDTCTAGSSIRSIAADGTFTCEPDDAGPDPQQVLWVAKSGGDFTSVQAALDSITDAAADKPYLIKIAPGVYTEQVTLKEHVALEGAGEGKTILRWTGGNSDPAVSSGESATVIGANHAELRLLTIESVAGGTHPHAVAIWNRNASTNLSNITATASGGTTSNDAVLNRFSSSKMTNVTATASGGAESYGMTILQSSSLTMVNVTATASGATNSAGLHIESSSLTMDNVTATASGGTNSWGVHNASSSLTMTNVTASASGGGINNYGVANYSSSPTMDNVTATASGGTHNRGVYNGGSSPTMTNVTATASGGTTSYGVYNQTSSSPTMTNVTATASGGSNTNYGVYNQTSSSPTMDNVTATASGGSNTNYGVYNQTSSPTMDNVTATASGASVNMGVSNFSSSPTIRDSTLTGSTNSVNHFNSTVRVANSQLVGDVSPGVKCFNNYNANFAPVTCP
jgi:hypothetical protein